MEIRVWFCRDSFNFIAKDKSGLIRAKNPTRIICLGSSVYVQVPETDYEFKEVTIDLAFIEANCPKFFKEI